MKRFDKIALRIFICELPIVMIFILSCQWLSLQQLAETSPVAKVWYNFGGFLAFSWAFLAIYFSGKMLLRKSFRQVMLARMTCMRERDEREIFLTGQAAKNTMLTTLAILIFLFCLSCFNFSYVHVPQEVAVDGRASEFSWGMGFGLTNNTERQDEGKNYPANTEVLYSYDGLPISTQVVLLGLIGWQIFSYNYYMKHRE